MPDGDLQTSQANRSLQVTFIFDFPYFCFIYVAFRVCVFRGWSNTTVDGDTCFSPDWTYMPNIRRTLGALVKDDEDNENGFMLWHDMIVPRSNTSQSTKKRK